MLGFRPVGTRPLTALPYNRIGVVSAIAVAVGVAASSIVANPKAAAVAAAAGTSTVQATYSISAAAVAAAAGSSTQAAAGVSRISSVAAVAGSSTQAAAGLSRTSSAAAAAGTSTPAAASISRAVAVATTKVDISRFRPMGTIPVGSMVFVREIIPRGSAQAISASTASSLALAAGYTLIGATTPTVATAAGYAECTSSGMAVVSMTATAAGSSSAAAGGNTFIYLGPGELACVHVEPRVARALAENKVAIVPWEDREYELVDGVTSSTAKPRKRIC